MFNTRLDYLICEYMVYCRSRQLRAKTMNSYEQGLRLFERWCQEQMGVDEANKITENGTFLNIYEDDGEKTHISPSSFIIFQDSICQGLFLRKGTSRLIKAGRSF